MRVIEALFCSILIGFYLNYVFWAYQDMRITLERGDWTKEGNLLVKYAWMKYGNTVMPFLLFGEIFIATLFMVNNLLLAKEWWQRIIISIVWVWFVGLWFFAFFHYFGWASWLWFGS